jgi:hypothetical protein
MVLSTFTNRKKYALSKIDTVLAKEIISPQIFKVDTGNSKTIESPYFSATTTTGQNIAGTYTPANATTNDDTLTVNKEFINAQHVFDSEQRLSNFDTAKDLMDEMTRSFTEEVDKWALNRALADVQAATASTASFATAAGGITKTNAMNVIGTILGNLSGYKNSIGQNPYLVIENTELGAFIEAQAAQGFAYADKVMYTGLVRNMAGVDLLVARTGTFVSATVSGDVFTNAGKRLFGVYNKITLAVPSGSRDGKMMADYEELKVSGKTGMELRMVGYGGVKVWTPAKNLSGALTITP